MEPRVANKPEMGFYSDDDQALADVSRASSQLPNSVQWESSEYIHHEKGVGWVLVLIIVATASIVVAIWLAQWSFAVLLAIMFVAFGYYAVRKPKTLTYKLDHSTLTIGTKVYALTDFRAFGVVKEGAFYSIRLIPVKRFGFLQAAYVSSNEGEAVVDILGAHLPMEEMHSDPIEQFMSKLRF